ncbi:hypothetical protein ACSYAD_18540 [Acaryochloris marina NIES-2412]
MPTRKVFICCAIGATVLLASTFSMFMKPIDRELPVYVDTVETSK